MQIDVDINTLKQVQLTKHFFLTEFLNLERHPDNLPSLQVISNLAYGCATILEPARIYLNAPIIVTSGYRNATYNKEVGGKVNSQHLYGCAADIKVIDRCKFSALVSHIRATQYDQLLTGKGWLHVSWSPMGVPRRYFKANYYTY